MLVNTLAAVEGEDIAADAVVGILISDAIDDGDNIPQLYTTMWGNGDLRPLAIEARLCEHGGGDGCGDGGGGDGGVVVGVQALAHEIDISLGDG